MMRSVIHTLFACAAFLAGDPASGGDTQFRRYELPNLDTLELTMPAGWVDAIDMPPGGVALTIKLTPVEGSAFEVHVSPQWTEPGQPGVMDAAALREAVREAAERIKPQAIEQTIEIRGFQGQSGIGFNFSATDRAPAPEEYRHMTQGGLQTGDLILWFTILTNDGQETVVADALAMLQSAVHRDTGLDQR